MSRSTGIYVHETDVLVPASIDHRYDTNLDYDATFVPPGPADYETEIAAWPVRATTSMADYSPDDLLPDWTDPEFADIQDWY